MAASAKSPGRPLYRHAGRRSTCYWGLTDLTDEMEHLLTIDPAVKLFDYQSMQRLSAIGRLAGRVLRSQALNLRVQCPTWFIAQLPAGSTLFGMDAPTFALQLITHSEQHRRFTTVGPWSWA
jgi:hypothetical protein